MIGSLENSRLVKVIEQVEAGEKVDWARVGLLQTLDVARAGQQALVEALEQQDEANEHFRQLGDE